MHRFYVTEEQINQNLFMITGPDVNHIKNVLRMKPGEEIVICNGQGKDCYCIIKRVSDTGIEAEVDQVKDTGTELPVRISLFQGLPKLDKLELIIQKAVELGVYEIIPIMTARSVVRLEDRKKEEKKLSRWQSIAESAAKQSGRGIIPRILPVMTFKEAINYAGKLELSLIPYENSKGMSNTRQAMDRIKGCQNAGVMIGPEGGFEEAEIRLAEANHILPVSLGRRILRTETAGLAVLSMMMLILEED